MPRSKASWTMIPAILALLPLTVPDRIHADQPREKIPIILDCDMGTDIDDTFALALALLSPEIDLLGVTTVSGDTHTRAQMACRLLTASGHRDIPVAAGVPNRPPQPLRGYQLQYARHPAVIYNRTSRPLKEPAVTFLYNKLKASPGKITLVSVGPTSNIAQLLTEHPDCKPWIKRLVMMGGSVRVGYNNKPPIQAEFNIRADPRAAQVVFTSGLPLTVAPLDATTMLTLSPEMLQRIFSAGAPLNYQVQALFQLWDQKDAPVMYDPVAVTLSFTDRFCTMEDLCLEVDDKGFTRIKEGKPNAHVATSIRADDYRKWFVDRFAANKQEVARDAPRNPSKLIPRRGLPNRVHTFEDYETDIERRWWMTGKPETADVPPGSTRACRAVLTQDFDGKMGNPKAMYNAVIFNPVPGPPMGKNPRLSFRYKLRGTDTIRVQIYSLSNGYHRYLTLTDLPQGKWESATVDMTAARRPDGSGGPLSEGERIDDIQLYVDPLADLIADDLVLYDEAPADEKRPFPKNLAFTGWFDTGKQGNEWPGTYEIVPEKGVFWKAARSVTSADRDRPWLRIGLRGQRPLGEKTNLFFRYKLEGADSIQVALVNSKTGSSYIADLELKKKDSWSEALVDLTSTARPVDGQPGKLGKGTRVDEIRFLLPKGAQLIVDDLLLYEPRP